VGGLRSEPFTLLIQHIAAALFPAITWSVQAAILAALPERRRLRENHNPGFGGEKEKIAVVLSKFQILFSDRSHRLTPAPGDSGFAADGMLCFLPGCAIIAKSFDCLPLRLSQAVRPLNKISYA
jgi:hypothetical protein